MQMVLQQTDSTSACKRAIAPVIAAGQLTFDAVVAGEAGALPLPVTTIATGASAPYSGSINVAGCKGALIELDFLVGGDCDSCNDSDTITVETQSFLMPANATYDLPTGFWSEIRVTLVDAAGAPIDLEGIQTETVTVYSSYQPSCPECLVLVP